MKTSIRHRLPDVISQVDQVPGMVTDAARRAVNATLPKGRAAVYEAMRRVFDRPTPYALNSLRVDPAPEVGQVSGAVMVKGRQDARGGGVPAQSYLRAEITGGSRRWKRFEVALMRRGILSRGWYAVPGKGARLDLWGNMSRGQVVEIMSWLQLFGVARGERKAGHRANKTERSKARARAGTARRFGMDVIVSSPLQAYRRGGLPFGIYTRQSNARTTRTAGAPSPLRLVVLFVKSARYSKRLDFYGELERTAAKELPVELDRAVARVRALRPLRDAR